VVLKSGSFLKSIQFNCCVPGTARILKGALSLSFILKLIKSQTQPVEDSVAGDGVVRSEAERLAPARATAGSVQRYSGMATGYPVTVLGEEAALPKQGTANA